MPLSDFNSVCSNLSDQALIHLGYHKVERNRRVTLQVADSPQRPPCARPPRNGSCSSMAPAWPISARSE